MAMRNNKWVPEDFELSMIKKMVADILLFTKTLNRVRLV